MYEVESYWDKSKKQPRQNRKYLGKKDPKTGKIISNNKGYTSQDYGTVYFLDKISKQIGLKSLLEKIFADTFEEILACIYFQITERKPLYLLKLWLESTHLPLKQNLSSQRISDLLKELGEDEVSRLAFLKEWAKMGKGSSFIVFDITSFSSYSKKLELVEWGYNRDREKLPQINFGLIYGEPSGLPLFYTKYPGSISDVSTLSAIVSYLEWLKIDRSLFILDKGFFSLYNLKRMGDIHFLIPLPYSKKAATELIEKHKSNIASHKNAFLLAKDVLYCAADSIAIDKKTYHAYIYLDEKRRTEERDNFLKKVFEVEKKIKDIDFAKSSELEDYLDDNVGGWKNIFNIYESVDKPKLERNDEGINCCLDKMGTTILITNKQIDPQHALSMYRRKDAVEKFFDNMKNDMDRKRLRIHNPGTFEGRLFVDFVALILYSHITKVSREEKIVKDYSVQEIIYELKKIKLITLGEKKTIITEVSKKQRELFEKFDIESPHKT
ncbi:MAG: IS1634 family transposase [Candidatus Humimicrobiaceae bacterium]